MRIRTRILCTLLGMALLVALVGALAVNRQRASVMVAAITEAENVARVLGFVLMSDPNQLHASAQEIVTRLHEAQGRDVVLVDAHRRILADAMPATSGKFFSEDDRGEVIATIRDGKVRTFVETSKDHPGGIKQIVAPVKSKSGQILGAVVLEYTPLYEELMLSTRNTIREVALAGFGSVAIALLIAFHVGRSIARPLQQLTNAATGFASGRIDLPMPPPRKDEIGELATAFNQMVQKRQAEKDELQRMRDELEVRVVERTAELAETNEALQAENAERKRAEAQRERLADIVEASPDFIGFADPKTTQIQYINKHGRRMCGIGEDEDIEKLKISDVHPTWMNKRFAEVILPAAVRDGLWQGEGAFLHRNGREIPVLMSLVARKTANGEVDIFFTVSHDITDHKHAEDLLRASEERYRSLFESNPNPMWVYDIETLSFLAVNATAVGHYGYSQDEFLAMTIKDIRPDEDIPVLMNDLSGKNGDVKDSTQWRHCRKDRTMIYVEVASHDLIWLGRSARLVLINDVTERKQVEERLREQADLLNLAQDAIMVRGMDDRIAFWNRGAEHLYGWSAEEVRDQPSFDFLDYEEPLKILAERTLLETGAWLGECGHLTKQGNTVIVRSHWTLVRNKQGEPKAKLIIMTDITEQKKLETHLLRAQRLESIGTLASGVAHDLNNILTPILMCAEILRENPDAEDAALSIDLIEESAKRGANVVKQVLTFARGIDGERVVIKPTHLIQEMIDIAQKTFPKTIEIIGRYPDDLWSIKCDPTQLHQVLLNLSVNARDAMPQGGLLTLAAENFLVDENYAAMTPNAMVGSYVMLRVSDSGMGMPRATVDKIFDPFFTTKEVGKGTGLGLSTALGIVKSHSGFISVYSELGKGTVFKIFLPATMSDVELQKSKRVGAPIRGNGEQILIVDDEPNILEITKRIFEKHNYRVISAGDGTEALALFAQQMDSIGGVLTDIAMPYMNGVALARALRRMKPDIPIVASTGQGDQPGVAELRSLGVTSFLTKPYDTEKLLMTLKTAMERQPSS